MPEPTIQQRLAAMATRAERRKAILVLAKQAIRDYVAWLQRQIRNESDRADRLDRARWSPGNGDMGG